MRARHPGIGVRTPRWDAVAKRQADAESGTEHYWPLDTRAGLERFTALHLAKDAQEYDVVADSDDGIDVAEPIAVSYRLRDLFDPQQ